MQIPGVGEVTLEAATGWHISAPIVVPVLESRLCVFRLEGYDQANRQLFEAAIANFLALKPAALMDAEQHLVEYLQDCNGNWSPDDPEYIELADANDVWRHVRLGDKPLVTRRLHGDGGAYVSIECGCDWEPEHGLQLVFRDGVRINKVGPYDGHLTNADAFARPEFEHVVYVRHSML